MRNAVLLFLFAAACQTTPIPPAPTCPDMSAPSADMAGAVAQPDLATAPQQQAGISTRKLVAVHDYDLDVSGVDSAPLLRASWTFGDCQPYVKVLDFFATGAAQGRLLVSIGAVPAPLSCTVEATVGGQVLLSILGALQISPT